MPIEPEAVGVMTNPLQQAYHTLCVSVQVMRWIRQAGFWGTQGMLASPLSSGSDPQASLLGFCLLPLPAHPPPAVFPPCHPGTGHSLHGTHLSTWPQGETGQGIGHGSRLGGWVLLGQGGTSEAGSVLSPTVYARMTREGLQGGVCSQYLECPSHAIHF